MCVYPEWLRIENWKAQLSAVTDKMRLKQYFGSPLPEQGVPITVTHR